MTSETSLAGRDDLVTRLAGDIERRSTRGVTLVGPPGIGKSALARAIAHRLATTFEPIVITGTPAAADIPLGAFAAFLPPVGTEPGVASLVHVRRSLAEAGHGRGLLVVDDAHCLDETSAALLHQVVAAGMPAIVTQRTNVPTPESVNRLWRDQLLERVDVGPLEPTAVADLIEQLLGSAPDPRVAEDVWQRTHGNPLYLRELVLGGRDAGQWKPGPSGWTWDAAASATPRLGELLRDRLGRLTDDERSALEHLAFAEPMGLGELERICGIEVLERLETLDLITAELDRRRLSIRHAHPLHAELVRRTLTALRARAIRRAIVDALRATGTRRRDDAMRLATLAVESGADVERSVLVDAARVASVSGDHETALRLSSAAFELEPDFATGQLVADALHVTGSIEEITAHWHAWAGTATSPADRAVLAMHRATGLYYRGGDEDGALHALRRAVEDGSPTVLADEVVALTATLHVISGRTSEGLELARPLLDRSSSPRALAQAALATTQGLRTSGRTGEALELNRVVMAQLDEHATPDALVPKANFGANEAAILLTAGRFDDALRAADDAVAIARDVGAIIAEGLALLARADALAMIGRLDEAATTIRRAEAAFIHANHTCYRWWAVATRGYVAALAGDRAGASTALADLDVLGEAPARLYADRASIAMAVAGFADDPGGVAARLLVSARATADAGNLDGAIRCTYELVRLGSAAGRDDLVAWCSRSDSELHRTMAAHAVALDDPDVLGDVAARFAALGARLFAADAALRAARLAEERRARATARRWERSAAAWMPDRPTEQASLGSTAELTRREQEIALLAARGLSSRAIGEQLFVSPRTVENHLARVYQKLGITNRAALAKELATA